MTAPRAAIVALARELVGTPFHHGQASRHGCDCVGLLRIVATELGYFDATPANPAVQKYIGYGRVPRPEQMRAALDEFLVEIAIADAQAGSVLWFKDGVDPRHLGILADARTIIHADSRWGGVIEHRLPDAAATTIVSRARIIGAWDYRMEAA